MKRVRAAVQKNRTLLLYLIAGGLTTLVRFALLFLFKYLWEGDLDFIAMLTAKSENSAVYTVANTLAVIGSIIFAYFINKLMVFQTKCVNIRALLREALAFFTSRGLTMLFDIGACAFLVSILGIPEAVTTLAVTVAVILLNYILSVTVVFRKKKKDG